jgi:hypothetical protein
MVMPQPKHFALLHFIGTSMRDKKSEQEKGAYEQTSYGDEEEEESSYQYSIPSGQYFLYSSLT